MKRRHLSAYFTLAAILSFALFAEAKEPETYGPYTALQCSAAIVRDAKVSEIVLKNSQPHKSGYRNWYNGETELFSGANQGTAAPECTDWVETSANYVEYSMDGALTLHLAKTEVHTPTK